jgi:hypothetical protein
MADEACIVNGWLKHVYRMKRGHIMYGWLICPTNVKGAWVAKLFIENGWLAGHK